MKRISTLIALLGVIAFTTGCADPKKAKDKPNPAPQLTLEEQLLEQVTDGEFKQHKYAFTTKRLLQGKLYPGDSSLKIIISSHDANNALGLGCAVNNGKITFVINIYQGKVDLNDSNLNSIIIRSIGVLCSFDDRYYGLDSYWFKENGVWVYDSVESKFDKGKYLNEGELNE